MKHLAAILVALVFLTTGVASGENDQLARVGSAFAGHSESVVCSTVAEDDHLSNAWGYTDPEKTYVVLRSELCATALDVNADPLIRALGIKVLVHESYHQRHWKWRRDEGRVECQAIRHFKVAAQMLGSTPEQADALMPYALFWYWQQATITDMWGRSYRYAECGVPFWLPLGDR